MYNNNNCLSGNCCWILILILILFCFGNGGCGNGCSNGCNNNCGC